MPDLKPDATTNISQTQQLSFADTLTPMIQTTLALPLPLIQMCLAVPRCYYPNDTDNITETAEDLTIVETSVMIRVNIRVSATFGLG